MLCSICYSDVNSTTALEDFFIDTYTILFQKYKRVFNISPKLCSWCRKTIYNIDRFIKKAIEAEKSFLKGSIANFDSQVSKFYNCSVSSNKDHYDEIIISDEKHNVLEVYITNDITETKEHKSESNIEIKYEPDETSFNDYNEQEFEEIPDITFQNEILQSVKVSHRRSCTKKEQKEKSNNKVKTENSSSFRESDMIKFHSFWTTKKALLQVPKEIVKCKPILLTDSEVNDEMKCKLEELKETSGVKYKCLLCVQSFEHEDKYTEHTEEHSVKPNSVLCKFCNIRIKNEQSVIFLHYRKHYVRFKCDSCDYICDNEIEMETHQVIHIDPNVRVRQYKCKRCGKKFKKNSDKQYHIDTEHKNIIHQCDYCNKVFKSYSQLKVHKEIHKNEYFPCDICKKTIKNRVSFEKHKRQHLKEEQGEIMSVFCSVCHKTYKSNLTYKEHLDRTANHKGERLKYKCTHCDKIFLEERSMEEHRDLVHLGGGVACEKCGKRFTRKSGVRRHLKTHEDQSNKPRDYVCDHCGKAFYTKLQLSEHVRIHSDERPLQCSKCSATFKLKAALYMHNRLVHEKFKKKPKPAIANVN